MPQTYEPIAKIEVSGSSNALTFNSIPSSFTDLILVIRFIGNLNSASTWLRINNDSSSIYSQTSITGTTFTTLSNTDKPTDTITNVPTNVPYLVIHRLFSYTNSNVYKSILSSHHGSTSGGGVERSTKAIVYASTSPITRLDYMGSTSSGNVFGNGTLASLYGIKAA